MKSKKRILDLKKRGANSPLVIPRTQKSFRNSLSLERRPKQKTAPDFELRRTKKSACDEIFVSEKPRRNKKILKKIGVLASLASIVLVLNFAGIVGIGKNKIESAVAGAENSVAAIAAAAEDLQAKNFSAAAGKFTLAADELTKIERDAALLAGEGAVLETQPAAVRAATRLLTVGRLAAEAGENFATAAKLAEPALASWKIRQQAIEKGVAVPSFTAQLREPITRITAGLAQISDATEILNTIDIAALPVNLQSKVTDARTRLDIAMTAIENSKIEEILPALPNLLGDTTPRRYLLLFQNVDEIRPTGGFIGSIGLLNLNDGFIQKFEIHDIYEFDGQLTNHLPPPAGFGEITAEWGLRDANWHPDFPTSATAAAALFEEAGGGTVDGVIAVNSSLLPLLVAAVDGIELSRFDEKIEADEILPLLELIIESKTDGASSPKKILPEISGELKKKLLALPPEQILTLATEIEKSGGLQFWSRDDELQTAATVAEFDGALSPVDGDYLAVVHTSLSGNKSDRFVDTEIRHATAIEDDEILDRVTIRRSHRWNSDEQKKLLALAAKFGVEIDPKLLPIFGAGDNVDLLKIFVPRGSELVAADGLAIADIETQNWRDKTFFLARLVTPAGETNSISLEYRLPEDFDDEYKFFAESQSGDRTEKILKTFARDGEEIIETEIDFNENILF